MRVYRFIMVILFCVALSSSTAVFSPSLAGSILPERASSGVSHPRQVDGPPGPADPMEQPDDAPPVAQPQAPTVEPVFSPAPLPTATARPVSVTASTSPTPYRPLTCGLLADFEDFGTWTQASEPNGTFTQSPEQRHGGAYSGKLNYDFPTASNDYVAFQRTIPMGGYGTGLTLWVYGDKSGHYLNALVEDAAGEIWSFPFGQVQHEGWQQMTAPLDVKAPWPAGSLLGPKNGSLDYPLSVYGLILDDAPDTYSGSGVIYVDDLSCSEALGPQAPPTPAIISNASMTGNLGGLIGGTLGDLIKSSAPVGGQAGGGQPGGTGQQGAAQPGGAGQQGGAQPGGAGQQGGAQPGAGQQGGTQPGGGQPGGGQTGGVKTGGGQAGGQANCVLTVLTPSKNEVVPGAGQIVLMEWKLDRPLAPDEYFFVVVVYQYNGQTAQGGTFRDPTPGSEILDGIKYNKFVFGKSTFACSDDGKYHWQVQVRRQQGTAPAKDDPVLCYESGWLTWRPWPHCPGSTSVAVQPTVTLAASPISVRPTDTPSAPLPPTSSPVAGEPASVPSSPCGLTLMSPNHGTKLGPEAKPLSLVWYYDRPLPDNQYFFAEIQYIKKDYEGQAGLGTRYQVGSYKDAANGVPEELRWTAEKHSEWTVPDMLCFPGYSDDGWYQWTVSVREKVMAEPSSHDEVICQSDLWSFNWSGCQQQDTSTCSLTLLTPPNNGQLNPASRSAGLGWQLNRPLAPEEFFFVEVRYPHKGQLQRYGSWGEDGTIANLRDPNFTLWQPYILCSDDGSYEWMVSVARRQGSQPSANDPVVCQSASGRFQWAVCDPMDQITPQAPQQPTPSTAGCQVTQLGPPNGAQFGPETENVVLEWQLNRALAPDEYFFANVEFPHSGQTWYDGTWRDAGQQLPDGTRNTSFALRNHLCQPGFSDTGQYTWYVAVLHQLGPEKSLSDGFVCRSDKRVFSWTGCAPPPPPEPEYDDYDDYDYDDYD